MYPTEGCCFFLLLTLTKELALFVCMRVGHNRIHCASYCIGLLKLYQNIAK